jgi:hypothetical protein
MQEIYYSTLLLPAIGLRLAAYLSRYAPLFWWRVCKLPRLGRGNNCQSLKSHFVQVKKAVVSYTGVEPATAFV